MKNYRNALKRTMISTAIVAAIAGLPASTALADGPRKDNAAAKAAATGDLTLLSVDTIHGTTVKNANGADLGTIDDMIVRRGSGEITHLILKTGAFLGLGGREVAVPFASFGFNPSDEHFTLHATPEQIDKLMSFSPEDRAGLAHKDLSEKSSELASRISREIEVRTSDPYAEGVRGADTWEFSGRIVEVDRHYTIGAGEFVTVHVNTSEGKTPVVLGPSWFVMSGQDAPMRGDMIEGEAFDVRGEQVVAKNVSLHGSTMKLRSSSGEAYWAPRLSEGEKQSKSANVGRFVLMSNLNGRDIECRGKDCGEIDDVIIDRPSGRIAFLSIDPDENFLGIGDTTRLIPWGVANVPVEGSVRVDASKQMVLSSTEMPDDLSSLNTANRNGRVFAAFQVDRPQFEPVMRDSTDFRTGLGGWESDGEFAKAIRNGKDTTIEGQVVDIINREPCDGVSTGRAVVVRTGDGEMKTVFVGPIWHTQAGLADLAKGDKISINAKWFKMKGSSCMVAESMSTDHGRIALWEDGPSWDTN